MIIAGVRLQPYAATPDVHALLKGTCPVDGDGWQLVLPRSTAVPITPDGPGLYRWDRSRRQTTAAVAADDGTMLALPWSWACGDHTLVVDLPAVDRLICQHDAGATAGCAQWGYQHEPKPADFYSNPRYGQSCECCGHAGEHLVRRDGLGDTPRCLR